MRHAHDLEQFDREIAAERLRQRAALHDALLRVRALLASASFAPEQPGSSTSG